MRLPKQVPSIDRGANKDKTVLQHADKSVVAQWFCLPGCGFGGGFGGGGGCGLGGGGFGGGGFGSGCGFGFCCPGI